MSVSGAWRIKSPLDDSILKIYCYLCAQLRGNANKLEINNHNL
jgi:hypothetical protein